MENVITHLKPLSTLYPLGVQRAIALVQSANIRFAMDCILDSMRQHDLEPIFETRFSLVEWDDARFALEALLIATFPEAFALECFKATADSKSILLYEAGLLLRQQVGRLLTEGDGKHIHGLTNLLKGFVLIYHYVFSSEQHPIASLVDAYNVLRAVDCVFARHSNEITRLRLRHYIKGIIHEMRMTLIADGLRAVVFEVDRRCTA